MFNQIPHTRPHTPLLDATTEPQQLRQLDSESLPQLSRELREFMLYSVGKTGGHFGAGLGVVELTIALHYIYNTPEDKLIWDVGHQAYPHKILTGRREAMLSIRQKDGLNAFPKRSESPYDCFGVGHSSTSISAALGMAMAAEMQGRDNRHVAIIGDGAMTAGMAFEALNHAAHRHTDMLVILNDNEMSISENVGGLSNYFSRIWASRTYNSLREGGKKALENMPRTMAFARRTEEHVKSMVSPGTLFEELGFNYVGPIDGHNLEKLLTYLGKMREIPGPKLLHVITQKGRGFAPAEKDPIGYHALNKLEPKAKLAKVIPDNQVKPRQLPKYSDIFGQWLCDIAKEDPRLVGITPAMREGSGMVTFSKLYPNQYQDVAIAEQHAVTLAAGLACEGQKPVVAIYSTFLQRAYDQLVHDVALQNLDVLFGVDRAGLVGEDGPTHAGAYDISFLRCIPNMVLMTPSDENECRQMLFTGYHFPGPAAVRYPRGSGTGVLVEQSMAALDIGKGLLKRQGKKVALLAFGPPLAAAQEVAERGNYSLADMRFVKPIDQALISQLANEHDLLVTLEENAIMGGAGSAVSEYLNEQGINQQILHIGIPDYYVEHGKPKDMLEECGISVQGIESAISKRLKLMAQLRLQQSIG